MHTAFRHTSPSRTTYELGCLRFVVGTSAMDRNLRIVARSLLLDREAARAVEHLRVQGVPSILLKGRTIATWLYDDGEIRPYVDVDLFVPPARFRTAIEELSELGYRPRLLGAHPSELGRKELDLIGPAEVCIDLHHGLLGAAAPSDRVWEVLQQHTVTLSLGAGQEVTALDVPARAMHLALHAAQNGPLDVKAVIDLERGLAKVSRSDWERAAVLADQIGATEAFAAGLRLLPAGEILAEQLSLTRRMSVELALRVRSAPQDALFFERFSEAYGIRGKTALVARKVVPTSASLRANSEVAARGSMGLVLARMSHPLSLAIRLGPAFVAWYRTRQAVRAMR